MADEIIIEEIVINSIVETVDKIAGKVVAGRDKTAKAEAIHDKIAEGAAELLVDPSTETIIDKITEEVAELLAEQPIEAIIEAVERVDEEANEIVVIDSSTEAIIDKFAGDEAINDNIIDPSIESAVPEAMDRVDEDTIDKIAREEAVHDNTAGERVDEFSVDPLIEAIQSRRTIDEEAEGPRFKSSPH